MSIVDKFNKHCFVSVVSHSLDNAKISFLPLIESVKKIMHLESEMSRQVFLPNICKEKLDSTSIQHTRKTQALFYRWLFYMYITGKDVVSELIRQMKSEDV